MISLEPKWPQPIISTRPPTRKLPNLLLPQPIAATTNKFGGACCRPPCPAVVCVCGVSLSFANGIVLLRRPAATVPWPASPAVTPEARLNSGRPSSPLGLRNHWLESDDELEDEESLISRGPSSSEGASPIWSNLIFARSTLKHLLQSRL